MIELKEGYAIEEEEYGDITRWKFTAPNEYKDRYFNIYEDALRYYITIHTQEELEQALDSFFLHYQATPEIQIRMPFHQEEHFKDCVNFGFTDYFLSHDYRHYMKHRLTDMYHRLTSWRNTYKDFHFEADEMRELCLIAFDVVKMYEKEMREFISLVARKRPIAPESPWDDEITKDEGGSDEEENLL